NCPPTEFGALRSQSVTSRPGWGGRRYLPWAFTEQGVPCFQAFYAATEQPTSIVEIIRAFVRLRRLIADNAELAARLDQLERRYERSVQDRGRRYPPAHGTAGPSTPPDWFQALRLPRKPECEAR